MIQLISLVLLILVYAELAQKKKNALAIDSIEANSEQRKKPKLKNKGEIKNNAKIENTLSKKRLLRIR